MKKFIFTLFLLGVIVTGYSQNTYYWVGGTTGAWNTSSSWNTTIGGGGTARSSANIADVLIFDGTNIGSGATGVVTPTAITTITIGQFILQNGASVIVQRGTSSGSGVLTIAGDGGPSDDFQIDASSSLKITSSASGFNEYVKLSSNLSATGTVYGTVTISDAGLGNAKLIDSAGVGSLVFASGSKCYINNITASDYPFGNSPTSVSSSSYRAGGIVFATGSMIFYQGGLSPFTQTSTSAAPMSFATGSNFEFDASLSTNTNFFSRHYFSNVIIGNNATVVADAAFYNIDTLTIYAGATFNLAATGGNPITGNIVNNGTLGAVAGYTSTQVIMCGIVPQTITGSGTFSGFSGFSVATDADVTLEANIIIGSAATSSTSSVSGKLNVKAFTISSGNQVAPGSIAFRSADNVTSLGTTTAGSNVVTLNASGYATGINNSNVAAGNLVIGTGIPANSYIISTSSSASQFTMSKAATITTATDAASIAIYNGNATLTTANVNGVDGSITTAGGATFGIGTNYVFNTATTSPFSIGTNNATGNVTFNAVATTNKSQTIGGVLTLANGNLAINNTDTLRLLGTASIAGTSSSRYIVTKASGATVGTLRIDSIATAKIFPVGSAANYLPVTITPSARDTFNVSVFEGLTANGVPNGTAFNATQKQSAIDAVWVINPKTNNGQSSTINLSWINALTGSRFFTFTNAQIGIGRNDGTNWLTTTGTSANNTSRNVTASYTSYGSFGIGELGSVLPVQLINFSASLVANMSKLSWSAANEIGIANYAIQKSDNGTSFIDIGAVTAVNNTVLITTYTFSDAAFSSNSYYRLKIVSVDGTITYSNILLVKNGTQFKVSTYPNPVVNTLNIVGLKGGELLVLYNVQGKAVLQKNVAANTSTIIVNIALLKRGIYHLQVIADGNTFTQTVIKN